MIRKLISSIGLALIAVVLFSACSDEEETISPLTGSWSDYSERFINDDLMLYYNDSLVDSSLVVINGISEGVIHVEPRYLIYGYEDIVIEADALEADSGYMLSADVEADAYHIVLNGFLDNDSKLMLDVSYSISDSMIGSWDIPSGRFSDAFEFTMVSENEKFKFLDDSLSLTALQTSVNVTFEALIKRYLVSATFDDEGTWNVVYSGREEQLGVLPDGMMLYTVTDGNVNLGINIDYLEFLSPDQLSRFKEFALMFVDGLPMTRDVTDGLHLTLERETVLTFLSVVESLLNRLSESGEDIDETLLQSIEDLAVIVFSCSEFDMTVKFDAQ